MIKNLAKPLNSCIDFLIVEFRIGTRSKPILGDISQNVNITDGRIVILNISCIGWLELVVLEFYIFHVACE
jgi:hypothetical protein